MQKTTLQLVAIFILLGWGTTLYGQEQDCPRIDCGTIFANAEFGTNLVFCEGDTVTLTNTSEPGYDLFIVDWADGTVDTLDNYGTFVHAYENVFEDTCTNRRTFNIQFQGLSYCDEGFTCATLFYPVRIDPPVLADFEVAASACVGQDIGIVNTSCNADSYEWDFGDGNTSTDVNPGHAYSEPGVYTICLTAFGVVCEPDIECKTVLVVDPPSSSFTADGLGGAGGNVVCEDEIVTFSSTSELATTTIWSITPGQNDTTLWCYTDSTMTRFSDSISILFKEVGTYTIELIGSNACGDTIQELIVEVQDTPAIALEPPIPGCDSLRVVLADLNFGVSGPFNNVSWVFENADIEGSNQQDFGSILFNESGRIIAIVEGDCGTARDTVEAIVEIPQPLSLAGNPTQYCRGSSPDTLRANLPGGIWSGNGIINGSIGLFDPGEAGVGVHELSYVFVGVACVDSATITVEVTPSASIMLSPLDLCEDAPPTLLTASPPGGTWSHPHISPAGIFDPTSSGPGLFRPRYEFIDSNDCRVQRRTNVQVARLPEIMATDSALTCFLDAPLDLLDFGQVSVDSVGGDFQCQLNGVDLVDCSFNPAELGLLPFNFYQAELTYTYEECTVQRDFLLEVTENPPLTLDPLDTICINLDTFRLAANLEGGIWSGPGIDSISGLIDLSVAGGGTHQFTYSFEPDGTCEQIASQEVSIDDPNVIINVGPDEAVCEGVASTHILSLASPDGGRWSGPGIIDPSLGRIDLDSLIPGEVYTYNYTFTSASSDNCLATRPKTLTYHPRPDPNVVVDGLLCLNETLTFTTNNNTNNFSCQWDFGDGSTSTDCSPSHVYTEPGTYTITYRVEESHTNSLAITCSADTSFTISVVSPPQPAFILDSLEGCAPFSLGITDNSIGEGASQVWCIGEDTIVGSLPTDYILDNFIDDTWVTVSLKMNNFCGTRTTEDSILVKPYPQVNFGFEFDDGCSPFTPDIRNVTIGNPVTWFWDMGQGTIGTDSLPPVVTYTTPDDSVSTYDITLISANACGRDTLVQTISVFPPNVEAFIGLDTVSGCGPWQFSPQSFSTPGAAIAWEVYNPSGLLVGTSSSAEPVFDLFDIGMHTIILLADGCGVDQDTAFFEVLPSPPVSFNHPPQVCLGEPLSFTNTSPSLSGGVWDFGDGTTSEQLNPMHMFDSVGTYTISFTGFSQLNNCHATVVSEVEVVGLPQTAFIPLDTADCSPFFVSFQNNSQALGPAVYTWDFGDGSNTTNETNPSHFYLDPGDYTVTLEVTDGNGCQHDTSFNFIRVHPDPVSAFELANPPVCTGDSLRIFNNSLGATSFFWRWGDEDFTGAEFPLLPAGPVGSYSIELIAESQFGCRDTSSLSYEVQNSPAASIEVDVDAVCLNEPIMLTSSSQHTDTWLWDLGDQTGATSEDIAHIYPAAGDYEVSLIAGSLNGCPGDTAYTTVTIHPLPNATFSARLSSTCGTPVEVQFTNTTTGGISYAWEFGNGEVSAQFEPMIIYQETGPYEVQLATTNVFGCVDTTWEEVFVRGAPIADFPPPDALVCTPHRLLLTAEATQALRYEWYINDAVLPVVGRVLDTLLTELGSYDISLVAIYDDFCRDTLTRFDAIELEQQPIADFSVVVDELPEIRGDVRFVNESLYATEYFWDFGYGDTSTEFEPIHDYTTQDNIVLLAATARYSGGLVCSDTITKPVSPEWLPRFYVPTAMAPDARGAEFAQFGAKGTGVESYTLEVFSPYGQLVFRTEEVTDNQPTGRWDGTFPNSDEIVLQGAYTWRASVDFVDGNHQDYVGTVTVIR